MTDAKRNPVETINDGDRKYRAPALEKGLDILELLAAAGAPMTTSQMATTLGRSVGELFRMVLALEYRGYITPSSDTREGYILTSKLFTLGIAQGSARTLLELALPVMNELTEEIGQSCHLVVPSGDQIVVIARIESPMDLGFSVRVGYRRRLIDTYSGLMLFGLASPETQKTWLPVLNASAEPEAIARFRSRAASVAEQGYIQAPSDFVEGVIDICMPVMGRQGAIATVTVPYIAIKAQSIKPDQVREALRVAARKISQALG